MCTAGQRVSLTITGPGPSFSLFLSPIHIARTGDDADKRKAPRRRRHLRKRRRAGNTASEQKAPCRQRRGETEGAELATPRRNKRRRIIDIDINYDCDIDYDIDYAINNDIDYDIDYNIDYDFDYDIDFHRLQRQL